MSLHPNEERLSRLYDHFSKGGFESVLKLCTDDITFTVPGHTPFSGVHTKANFAGWISMVWTISGGRFRKVPYWIVANERTGVVLLLHSLTPEGRELRYRIVHLWEIRDGLFTRWEEWPGDEEAFTAA